MLSPLDRLVDRIVPPRTLTPHELLQLRFLAGCAVLGLFVAGFATASSLAFAQGSGVLAIIAFGLGCLALLAAIGRGLPLRLLRQASLLLLGMFFVVVSLQTREIQWSQFKWLALLPISSLVFADAEEPGQPVGRPVGSLWRGTVFALALAGVIYVANSRGWTAGGHVLATRDALVASELVDFALFTTSVAGLLTLHHLALRRAEAELALLRSMLSICAWCRRIRDDHVGWVELEQYLGAHTSTRLTHGICPECSRRAQSELS